MRDTCVMYDLIIITEQGRNYPLPPPSASRMSSKDSDQSDVFSEGTCQFWCAQIQCVVDQTGAAASGPYQRNTVTPPHQQRFPKSEFNAVLLGSVYESNEFAFRV